MRQLLQNDMVKNNWSCRCIRCREIKDVNVNAEDIRLDIQQYNASNGVEYFISFETDKYIIGFIRLRLNNLGNGDDNRCEGNTITQLPVLRNAALIRELHVYSNLSDVGNNISTSYQHKGYGKKLLETAENIAKENGFRKMAIISGTGVRNYYRNLGYQLTETYMIKDLLM